LAISLPGRSMNDDFPECPCARLEVRRRDYAGGTSHAVLQCQDCGRQVKVLSKQEKIARGILVSRLPSWDAGLPRRWSERRSAHWKQKWEAEKAGRDAEFWRRYEAHMNSPEWQELRRRVFLRCKNVCEGCGINRAVQVHHLTYARLGNEMLFDLVAVCLACHESIHGHPIGEESEAY
jgi:hypothetical protein